MSNDKFRLDSSSETIFICQFFKTAEWMFSGANNFFEKGSSNAIQ